MFPPELKERVNIINSNLSWSDISSEFSKEHGTVTCPSCLRKNKGYLTSNFFRCYSSHCEIQGDKVTLFQKLNGLKYMDALKSLETSSGLDHCLFNQQLEERNSILSDILSIYSDEIKNHPNVLSYLEQRGFTFSFIEDNLIGYAPSNHFLDLYDLSHNKLTRHGLKNKYGDFFYQRIIFPIYNEKGYLVHLTGRSFNSNSSIKYKDTLALPLIGSSKNHLLFEKEIDEYINRSDTVFLVEGVPDSFILKMLGYPVLGLMGLEKLLSHFHKLKHFKSIIAIFDNDRFDLNHPNYPGELKSWRRITSQLLELQYLLGEHSTIFIYMIPEDYIEPTPKDINELYLTLNKNGDLMYELILEEKKDLLQSYINEYGGDLSYHKEALKLIHSTNRCKLDLLKYIPEDLSPIEYALKLFG